MLQNKNIKYQAEEFTTAASLPAGEYSHKISLDAEYDRCTGIVLYEGGVGTNMQFGLKDNNGPILDFVHENLLSVYPNMIREGLFLPLDFPIIKGQGLVIRQLLESANSASEKYTNVMFRLEKLAEGEEQTLSKRLRIQTLDLRLATNKAPGAYDFIFPIDGEYNKITGIYVESLTAGGLSIFRTNYGLYSNDKALFDPFMLYGLEPSNQVENTHKFMPTDIDVYEGMNLVVRLVTKQQTTSEHRSIVHLRLEK